MINVEWQNSMIKTLKESSLVRDLAIQLIISRNDLAFVPERFRFDNSKSEDLKDCRDKGGQIIDWCINEREFGTAQTRQKICEYIYDILVIINRMNELELGK
jgi:hypothetical protein